MSLEQVLNHPAFQSSVVPLLASLIASVILIPLRLSGLGVAAGSFAAVYAIGNFALEPLTATRKIVIVAAAASALGAVVDIELKPNRATGVMLGVMFGAASIWVFWAVLAQLSLPKSIVSGTAATVLVLWLVAATLPLRGDPIRAGAAGLGLGLGTGTAAVLGASALLGQYGLALGAACGGYLLLVIVLGRRVVAGASLVLTVAAYCGLLGGGAVLLAQLDWLSLVVIATVPLAVRLPLPEKSTVWIQTFVASLYSFIVAATGCGIAYFVSR